MAKRLSGMVGFLPCLRRVLQILSQESESGLQHFKKLILDLAASMLVPLLHASRSAKVPMVDIRNL